MGLPHYLAKAVDDIAVIARAQGLDFFDTVFEEVNYRQMNELASYEGFSTRYPHWRFGMTYEQMKKSYAYGLHKIYEMVINNDPTYAYLLEGNSLVDQKLVIAHVYAHSDFFKNNLFFAHTNRKMVDEMANHAVRVRRHMEKLGRARVEEFLDACLSINNLIDIQYPYQEEMQAKRERAQTAARSDDEGVEERIVRFRSKDYMESFVNPETFIEQQRDRLVKKDAEARKRFPARPVRDVMWFLLENAPLQRWQQDILELIREEAYYFAPQGQTKILNEGWAAYWHSRIMTEKVLDASEIVDFADHHSQTVAPHPRQLNPYKLGLDLLRDIRERWDAGRFGKAYDECQDQHRKANWDRRLGLGMEKLFEVRKTHNDVTFLDEFLTEDFVWRSKYYLFGLNKRTDTYEILTRNFKPIKEQILASITNFGQPVIHVVDANHENRGELLLEHRFDGQPLRKDYAVDVLKHLVHLWGRPVSIRTQLDEKNVHWSFDGKEFTEGV